MAAFDMAFDHEATASFAMPGSCARLASSGNVASWHRPKLATPCSCLSADRSENTAWQNHEQRLNHDIHGKRLACRVRPGIECQHNRSHVKMARSPA